MIGHGLKLENNIAGCQAETKAGGPAIRRELI
jgi:hypothetical protein